MNEAIKDFVKAFGVAFLMTYATLCTALVTSVVVVAWIKYVQP